jgi:hypothetical protein
VRKVVKLLSAVKKNGLAGLTDGNKWVISTNFSLPPLQKRGLHALCVDLNHEQTVAVEKAGGRWKTFGCCLVHEI